jgi:(p)ppGpp synthase/HD superfamily hydrolase
MSTLGKAIEIAYEAHEGQTRWGGEPYITHPEAVAAAVITEDEKIVAWLHDVVEDTNVTLEDLMGEGFSGDVIDGVDAMTKKSGVNYSDYLNNLGDNEIATTVKIADINHNLLTCTRKYARDKYQVALLYLNLCQGIHFLLEK